MALIDKKYHTLLNKIFNSGYDYQDPNRKEVLRREIPSYRFEYNMSEGFPAITTKTLYWKGVVGELLWFLKGNTNIKYLIDNDIHIWNKDAYNHYKERYNSLVRQGFAQSQNIFTFEEFIETILNRTIEELYQFQSIPDYTLGDLGRVYGAQWREWFVDSLPVYEKHSYNWRNTRIEYLKRSYLDQIDYLIYDMIKTPMSTRLIVTAWNPGELDQMALPPCHKGFQVMCYPLKKGGYGFDLVWEQRSVDTFLGLPFNIASYGLLMHILSKITGYIPGKLIGDLRNVHIYHPHFEAVKTQLKRSTNFRFSNCTLKIKKNLKNLKDLEKSEIDDYILKGYKSQGKIPAEMLALS